MENTQVVIVSIVALVVVAVIVLVNIRNNKDRKSLNPDAQDSVTEVHGDHERRRETD